jgi:hypothetical protein
MQRVFFLDWVDSDTPPAPTRGDAAVGVRSNYDIFRKGGSERHHRSVHYTVCGAFFQNDRTDWQYYM